MIVCIAIIMMTLLYLALVSIFYFKKQRLNNYENKLYAILVKLCLIGLPLELACCYTVYNKDLSSLNSSINVITCRIFLIYMLAWLFCFTTYILSLSFGKREKYTEFIVKNKNKIIGIILVIFGILSLLAINLPLHYHNTGGYVYSYGTAANLVTGFGAVSIVLNSLSLIINLKIINIRKYAPLFTFVFLMIVACILREVNPGITAINSMFAFITILMYFTIENPDMLMVNELLKNREIVENSFQEKSNILFKISQEVKNPINNIKDYLLQYKEVTTNEDKEKIMELIEKNTKDVLFIVNDVLDISSMNGNKTKFVKNNYNSYAFFLDIKSKMENAVHKNLKVNFSISDGLPKFLLGDSVMLKQALMSFIFNAIQFTESGFVDVDVSGFTKYDVCRLIITIHDSGVGMNLELINDVLSKSNNITEEDYSDFNKMDVKLNGAIKIIKMLGGIVNIKSDLGRGTEIVITLDQNFKVENNNGYVSKLNQSKKVLVVCDNAAEMDSLKRELSKYDLYVTSTLLGADCVAKIRAQERYDLIILKDDMMPLEALPTLKKLKEIEKFKIPVVVLIDDSKEHIIDHYLNDGFSDYILKNKLANDIKRVLSIFL